MKIEFLDIDHPKRDLVQAHIQKVYQDTYGAKITSFAPLLVSVEKLDGEIVCAGGIRTAQDGFFSDTYLDCDLNEAIQIIDGTDTHANEIMEVVSVASTTPFPVLPMLDAMIAWGREQGMTCGVFTATGPLRKLLKHTKMPFKELCKADALRIEDPESWGTYYQSDPAVCVFNEALNTQRNLSPRAKSQITSVTNIANAS